MLKEKNKKYLESLGLELAIEENTIAFIKKSGIKGNYILEWRNNKEHESDCPIIHLRYSNEVYELHHWDWAPGPGPGDFRIKFAENSLLNYP